MIRASLASSITLFLTAAASAQVIHPPFDQSYSFRSLGTVPGVPGPYGGVTFRYDDPDVLLIGGNANNGAGAIFQIRVTRAANGAITGFQGNATQLSTAPNIDGGLQYGPNNVLFFTLYPTTAVGQIKPGSATPDKTTQLTTALGWTSGSPGALSFVPPGFPGAGHLKLISYSGSVMHSCTVQPDGQGTFDLAGLAATAPLSGGPEGLLYPPPGSPLFPDYARVLVNEYGTGSVVVYDLDPNGNAVPATRTLFMTGLAGAEGATIDARTGSFLFSTYGGGSQVIVVDGFGTCGSFVNYGTGIPGAGGRRPSIRGTGCASFNRAINYQTGNAPVLAAGALNIGFQRLNIPLFGGFVLTDPSIPIGHMTDGSGTWTTTISTPNDPNLVGRSIFFQAAYIDSGSAFGVTASDGLEMRVR